MGGEVMWFVMQAVPTTNDGLAALVALIPAAPSASRRTSRS
ncbi:MAG: hypothetical protein R2705_17760 [Ilumatobacteraceae bacterium]